VGFHFGEIEWQYVTVALRDPIWAFWSVPELKTLSLGGEMTGE